MLQDLVQQLDISDCFTLSHPQFGERSLPVLLHKQLFRKPALTQAKCLTLHLRNYLYENYFLRCPADHSAEGSVTKQNGTLEAFRDQLDQSNCGQGYWDAGWTVLGQRDDGFICVRRNGITLDVHPQQELPADLGKLRLNQKIAIKLPHNRVEPGAYIAIGDRGPVQHWSPEPQPLCSDDSQSILAQTQLAQTQPSPLLNVYFNVRSQAAAALMEQVTHALNGCVKKQGQREAIAFNLAMLNHPAAYNRPDSAVLSIYRRDWPQVSPLIQEIAIELHRCQSLRRMTLPLAQWWLPGVCLAEEPSRSASICENFGLHRCYAIAQGLLKAKTWEKNCSSFRLAYIQAAFAQWNIRWDLPYLNVGSEAIDPGYDWI